MTIFATDEVGRRFLVFQQYYETFAIMEANGVFGQKNAAITLHFDKEGLLKSIKRTDSLYDWRGEHIS